MARLLFFRPKHLLFAPVRHINIITQTAILESFVIALTRYPYVRDREPSAGHTELKEDTMSYILWPPLFLTFLRLSLAGAGSLFITKS